MGKEKNNDLVRRSRIFKILDELSEQIRKANTEGKHHVNPGGDLHEAYLKYRKEHPDTTDEFHRAYHDIRTWDEGSRPKIDKNRGQGVLAFYVPRAMMPVDGLGGRKPFEDMVLQDLDAWWEIQEEEDQIHREAHAFKRTVYAGFRNNLEGPKDKVGRVAIEVFGYRNGQ